MLAQAPPPAPAAAPAPNLMNPSTLKAQAPDLYRVKFTTTHGDFVIEVHRAWAPLGADRFYNLVVNHFFDDAAFFRNVPGFMVQFGIPANPAIGQKWQAANIKDDPVKHSNTRGTITFAKTAEPNSRSTQLFINFDDKNTFLDGQGFAAFGSVVSGMSVVDGLYNGYGEKPDQGAITTQGKAYLDKNFPKLDSIKSTTIEEAPAAAGGKKKK